MDEKLTSKASHRISGKLASGGRCSNSSAHPGQNDGISDGFLPMTPVDTCHSGQPGKTTDPQNPMKSKNDPPSEGFPPDPPYRSEWFVADATISKSATCESEPEKRDSFPHRIPHKLTRKPGSMPRKKKRRNKIVEEFITSRRARGGHRNLCHEVQGLGGDTSSADSGSAFHLAPQGLR
jgi:hypothetical protein